MQPYLFPYPGYFQLIMAADKFVIYDDVNFIKHGWINRNYILLNGAKHLFTIPIQNISSYSKINETIIADKPFNWENKLLQTLNQAYKKAPFFNEVFPILELVIRGSIGKTISGLASESIVAVMEYLSATTLLVQSSKIYENNHLKNEDRVIDICLKENAKTYVNAIGGIELYNKNRFAENKIRLQFIQSKGLRYKQFGKEFIDGLSIIDCLMFNSPEEIIKEILPNYNLI
jgi:hypothetical protein